MPGIPSAAQRRLFIIHYKNETFLKPASQSKSLHSYEKSGFLQLVFLLLSTTNLAAQNSINFSNVKAVTLEHVLEN